MFPPPDYWRVINVRKDLCSRDGTVSSPGGAGPQVFPEG